MREEWKDAAIGAYRTRYHQVWGHSFDQLSSGNYDRCVWYTGPSSYLLRWGSVRIGIDLQFRMSWIREQIESRLAKDLASLDALIVTHSHSDHFDPEVLKAVAGSSVKVYLPAFLDQEKVYVTGLTDDQIVWLAFGDRFSIGELSFTTLEAPHMGKDGHGVPEVGFIAEGDGKRIFFPGDVRNYETTLYSQVGHVDTMFLHIWLGRGNALNFPCEPWLSELTAFASSFTPDTVYCGHLYEIGRPLHEMWTYTHAGLVRDSLVAQLPDCDVTAPRLGQPYPL
ncbi:MAG: MBL fold metallo-hydrolase [Clostridia bacterium]|nr:MBL fold metallo-hydrolase [Clostridia bacterium]